MPHGRVFTLLLFLGTGFIFIFHFSRKTFPAITSKTFPVGFSKDKSDAGFKAKSCSVTLKEYIISMQFFNLSVNTYLCNP